jgi:glycerol-3-phosphate acyltransferase PlsY
MVHLDGGDIMAAVFLWSLFGYLCGAIPFALILGKAFARRDIRNMGDGNPGGTNAWKAGGWKLGLSAILLEIFKGFLPVALARHFGISDWSLVPVSLAPIAGHAMMPFLSFRGGKALGATGGVWIGILGPSAFLLYAATAILLAMLIEHAWAAILGVALFFFWAVFVEGSEWMAVFGILNLLLIVWTHRRELVWPPHPRHWLAQLVLRRSE